MAFLSEKFLDQYRDIQPRNKGRLFEVVYLRTYSRWLPEKKRRETWLETVQRVVEYSMSLYQGPRFEDELIREAEMMFDRVFHLEVLPAGRTLWVGGTESSRKFGESQFNCSFAVIDSFEIYGDFFQLLLCGCGVGFRVLPEDVAKLSLLTTDFEVLHESYDTLYPLIKEDQTKSWTSDIYTLNICIGDSREAWVQALRDFFNFLVELPRVPKKIIFNYDLIRPEGSRIFTFGGKAPGPEGLKEMFVKLEQVIKSCGGKVNSVAAMDIANLIAKNVIVGGTRRSSQVALGCPDDQEFIEAKKDLWATKTNLHRTMSNNSVTYTKKPTKDKLHMIFEGIKNNGEPGFFNLDAARKRRPDAEGSNPCMEISLANKGFCNLTTINFMSFVRDRNSFDYEAAIAAIICATRIGCRMTNVTVSLPEWDIVQKRDRLLGVSITGIMDGLDKLGWEFNSTKAKTLFCLLRKTARTEADYYADEMKIPRPLLVTCLKPEGTLSQLPTVSSGLHRAYAPYYIRRIRVSSMDAVAKALIKLGVPYEVDLGKSERLVFSFPIQTEAKFSASEESCAKQLDRYLTLMETYVDHNASTTIQIGEDEYDDTVEKVYENWDNIVAVAFLPKFTNAYPQLPYESISKEQYEGMMVTFPDLTDLAYYVNMIEQEESEEDELEVDCASGYCPIR